MQDEERADGAGGGRAGGKLAGVGGQGARGVGGGGSGDGGLAAKKKVDITETAKLIFQYETGITGKCKVMFVDKTVVVPGPRARSGAHDGTAPVALVGDGSWLDEADDDASLLQRQQTDRRRVCGVGAGAEIPLADLIDACGYEDNVLVFGVKELRNSLSSAGSLAVCVNLAVICRVS
jgi:hypothetical protein